MHGKLLFRISVSFYIYPAISMLIVRIQLIFYLLLNLLKQNLFTVHVHISFTWTMSHPQFGRSSLTNAETIAQVHKNTYFVYTYSTTRR